MSDNNNTKVVPVNSEDVHQEMMMNEVNDKIDKAKTKSCLIALIGLLGFCFLFGGILQMVEYPAELERATAYEGHLADVKNILDRITLEEEKKALATSTTTAAPVNVTVPKAIQLLTTEERKLIDDLISGEIGAEQPPDDLNWVLSGSIFFCMTLCTTIGYGKFTASTDEGKVLTIVICLLGISYFGYVLTLFSERTLAFIKFLYYKLKGKRKKIDNEDDEADAETNDQLQEVFFLIFVSFFFIFCFAVSAWSYANWDFGNAVYFAFVTFTTVGLGDFYPSFSRGIHWSYRSAGYTLFAFFALIGLALVSAIIEGVGVLMIRFHKIAAKRARQIKMKAKGMKRKFTKKGDNKFAGIEEDDDGVRVGVLKIKSEKQRSEVASKMIKETVSRSALECIRKEVGAGSDIYKKSMMLVQELVNRSVEDGLKEDASIMTQAEEIWTAVPDSKVYIQSLINGGKKVKKETV